MQHLVLLLFLLKKRSDLLTKLYDLNSYSEIFTDFLSSVKWLLLLEKCSSFMAPKYIPILFQRTSFGK